MKKLLASLEDQGFRFKLLKTIKNFILKNFRVIFLLKDVFRWISDNNFDYIIHLAAKVPIKYVKKTSTFLKNKF